MAQLTVGYSDSEDRLWLLYSDEGAPLWLTRRLTAGILTHLIDLMVKTCPGEIPMCSGHTGAARIALEHEMAMEMVQERAAGGAPLVVDNVAAKSPRHLNAVTLTVDAQQVRLQCQAPNYQRDVVLNRADTHQLLAAIVKRCVAADWNLRGIPDWLMEPAAA